AITPTLSRIYPNGSADVNHFHAAGGLGFVIRELIDHGLLHEDVTTVMGKGLGHYGVDGHLDGARPGHLRFEPALAHSADLEIVRPASDPVSPTGGLVLLSGNVGRAVIKVSAVATDRRVITAPAIVFNSQQDLMDRFKAGALERDFVAVLPFQGPKANGMPELHKLNPPLGVLQQKGFKVALITDGRMSGASGKVPSAIHLTPEALDGGTIARLRDGDEITLDAQAGTLSVAVAPDVLAARTPMVPDLDIDHWGTGRELFAGLRALVTGAEEGAMTLALKERPHDVV
ncbi:MAG: dihydroxy-acid dehydratase, partial [Pseudomonadota bacterium]